MIPAFLITIVIEGIVVSAYSIWDKKPVGSLLLTSIIANLLTQALLWAALNNFFRHYLLTLWLAEILIWMIESLCLYGLRFNGLNLRESIRLSFSMNLASFTLGWFLPV